MKKTKLIFLVSLFLIFSKNTFSQSNKLDSLYKEIERFTYKDPKRAIKLSKDYYQLAIKQKDTTKAITGLMNLSDIYSNNVNYTGAYDSYWKALLLAEKQNNQFLKGRIYQGLGWLYSFYNRDEEALKYFNFSLAINKELNKENEVNAAYLTSDYFALANFYRIEGDSKMFKVYLDSAVATKKLPYYYNANSNYLEAEIAYQLSNEKKYSRALGKLDSIKTNFSKIEKSYLVVIDYMFGHIYGEMGDFKKSEEAYLESLIHSERSHSHTNYKIMSCDALVELYKKQGDYKKAFEFLKRSKALNDSVFGSKSINNQHLFNLKDTYRITKEKQKQNEQELRLKQLEQEDYIWFLKYVILVTSIVFILIFGYLFIRNLRNKHRNEKRVLKERQEQELIRKNEVLELKNKELTVSALQLIEKEEFLNNLKNKLSKQKDDNIDKKVIGRMINTIQGSPTSNWKEFEARFTSINQSFYKNLKEKYPNLGQTDQKICALIKLNFSSKEMSSLLGISVESVHTSRYRLRKKLGLDRNDSLSSFINSI
ncbi:hypothetical protein AXE80_01585 [Wenyingzhuangia fucanilytica]|uniref:HTH luxR-type domain-containing protein n=1 Tax=Wenyingzhuangia fucanilytica TaxID=1790137 RepID=A0A1B1Y2R2_9FLAO|nr:tetratricopeptide repeat protein [Wenyingzhuangia fucanilytica]ANW95065.1 hypothetical protein AXE80_01585 [Wenyingzhuangia fucanilytica]